MIYMSRHHLVGIHDDDTPGDLVVSVYEYVGFIIA
jgi:hypothetical protein